MSSSQWPSRLNPGAVDHTSFLRGHGLLGLLAGGNEHTRVVSGYVHDPGLFSGRSVLSWSGPYGGYLLHPVVSVLNRSLSGPERRSPHLVALGRCCLPMPASFKQRVQKLQWLRRRAAHTHAKQQGLSKQILRNKKRAANHAKRLWLRTRSKRTLYVRLQRRRLQKTKMSRLKAWQQGLRFATWNSRGLGAPSGKYPPEIKVKCFIRRMQIQQMGLCSIDRRQGHYRDARVLV